MESKWHDREEMFLLKIEKQANDLVKHNTKDHLYYKRLSNKFNVPILIISAVNALVAISLSDFLDQKFVSILNAVLSSGTGVLGSIQLYLKINEKMSNALRASILMKRLALKISKELSVDRSHRSIEGNAFLHDCFTEFTVALEQGNIPEKKLINHLSMEEKKMFDFKEDESISEIADEQV